MYPARRRLFSSIVLTCSNYPSWKKRMRCSRAEILNHVRSLHYWAPDPNRQTQLERPPDFNYLSTFRQLRSLTLSHISIPPDFSKQVKIFSAFQHTLRFLSLQGLTLTWSTFVTLIDYFPSLGHLELRDISYFDINWKQKPLSRPLRGALSIIGVKDRYLDMLFDEVSVACDTLTICTVGWYPHPTPEYCQSIIGKCAKNLQHLGLSSGIFLDISGCAELRRLEFYAVCPGSEECDTISSITSSNIRSIAFVSGSAPATPLPPLTLNPHSMLLLDDAICGLVDKLQALGYDHTLTLEFRHPVASSNAQNIRAWLPRFREKGRVIILPEV